MATDKKDQVTQTEQNILNKSQDTTFKVLAFEMLGYDSVAKTLNRIRVNSDGELLAKSKLTDGTNDLYIWSSGGITTVKAIHWRIKESKQWLSSYCWEDVAAAASVYFQIKTDATKVAHGYIVIESSGMTKVELFENPTLNSDGTAVAGNCLNRETVVAAKTEIYRDPDVSADGTLIEGGVLGTAGKFTAAGGDIAGGYWLLKPNEYYLIKVTNRGTEAIDLCIQYGWHEHTAA